jgi:hypothetical protein
VLTTALAQASIKGCAAAAGAWSRFEATMAGLLPPRNFSGCSARYCGFKIIHSTACISMVKGSCRFGSGKAAVGVRTVAWFITIPLARPTTSPLGLTVI